MYKTVFNSIFKIVVVASLVLSVIYLRAIHSRTRATYYEISRITKDVSSIEFDITYDDRVAYVNYQIEAEKKRKIKQKEAEDYLSTNDPNWESKDMWEKIAAEQEYINTH